MGSCLQGIFLEISWCEKSRKPTLQRSWMLPNALRNKKTQTKTKKHLRVSKNLSLKVACQMIDMSGICDPRICFFWWKFHYLAVMMWFPNQAKWDRSECGERLWALSNQLWGSCVVIAHYLCGRVEEQGWISEQWAGVAKCRAERNCEISLEIQFFFQF